MGVLTISRELGSSGDVIGKKVADELNWSLLDNEGFAVAADSYGYLRAEIERVDERSPSLIDRFFRDRQLVYLDIMRAIVYECALRDNYVILGRGGNTLLQEISGVFKCRIIAPDDIRQKRLIQNEGISAAMAEEFLRHNDRERMSYTRYFFDSRWGDPGGFDLVLNTGLSDENEVVQMLVKIMRREEFSQTSPSSSKNLQTLRQQKIGQCSQPDLFHPHCSRVHARKAVQGRSIPQISHLQVKGDPSTRSRLNFEDLLPKSEVLRK